MQETALDFIGIVKEVSPITDIKLKTQETKAKRTIDLIDNSVASGISISLTIWGE